MNVLSSRLPAVAARRACRWTRPAAVAALVLLAACDAAGPDLVDSQVVVESYLVAREPLPQLRLSRTAPVDGAYDFEAHAVSGAQVSVALLGAGGEVAVRYPYAEDAARPGVYLPLEAPLVEPLHTYALEIVTAESETVTARTVVPDTFRVVRVNTSTVVYQSAEQFEASVTPSVYPGRQARYIFTTKALDPTVEALTPLARALYDDGDLTLDELSVGSSPVLNEANYDEHPDGTRSIRLPWLAVSFYGENEISVSALDENLDVFVRSQAVQQGGSTLAPGEIPNVLDRVEGGTGIFGSLARATVRVTVLPPSPAAF